MRQVAASFRSLNPYNGYTPQEREKKLRRSYQVYPNRTHPLYQGRQCQLCGDPDCKVEPHSEDYSQPYLWENPAEYAVCKTCHSRLHKRFKSPAAWSAYKAHLRRGGYGSDLKTGSIARDVAQLAKAPATENPHSLSPLPRSKNLTGREWWEILSIDAKSLTDPAARPRP